MAGFGNFRPEENWQCIDFTHFTLLAIGIVLLYCHLNELRTRSVLRDARNLWRCPLRASHHRRLKFYVETFKNVKNHKVCDPTLKIGLNKIEKLHVQHKYTQVYILI